MHYTISYRRNGTEDWHDWRFCKGARVATWRSYEKAEAYCRRLQAKNPDFQFRTTGWLEAFSIPAHH